MEEELHIKRWIHGISSSWGSCKILPQQSRAGRSYVVAPEIRHKFVSTGDLLFGSIVVWGSERAAYTHQSSSRCHKRHKDTQLVESLLQWTQVCRDSWQSWCKNCHSTCSGLRSITSLPRIGWIVSCTQFSTMLMLCVYVKVMHNLFSPGWFLSVVWHMGWLDTKSILHLQILMVGANFL